MSTKAEDTTWMNPSGAKKAVVVKSREYAIAERAMIERDYPGHRVIVPGQTIARDSLGEIVMLNWRATKPKDFDWLNDVLLRALFAGRKLKHLDAYSE